MNLVRLEGTEPGVEINAALDLIDTKSEIAIHAAFGLIETLLGGADDLARLVTAQARRRIGFRYSRRRRFGARF
jgi:hypothetical protein